MTEAATKEELKLEKQSIDIEVRRVDLALKQAELSAKAAELAKATADAREAEAQARRMELLVLPMQREEERRELTKSQLLVYGFNADINDATVDNFVDWLEDRHLRFPSADLTVYLNSPGGSVFAGFVAMDAIREARTAGHKVTAKVTGMAASMAGVVAQAATERLIGVNSELMLHSVSNFQFGNFKTFDVQDQAKFMERLTRKLMEAYADRSEKWSDKVDELFARVNGERRDWWLTATEAVEEGFMDGTF